MFKFFSIKALIGTIAAMLMLGVVAHAQPASEQTPDDLIASWLVTVEGEARARILKVQGAEQKPDGRVALSARYGWVDGNHATVGGEITQSAQGRKLILTTQADSVIVATQSADGVYSGNITYKNGVVKPVKLTRTAESELAALKASLAGASVAKKSGENPELVVVYWGSADCKYCMAWQGSLGMEGKFRALPEFAKIKFYKVTNERLAGIYRQDHFSPELGWLWELYQGGKITHPGRPGWQVFVDRKRVASFQGSKGWEASHLPKIKQIIAENSKY